MSKLFDFLSGAGTDGAGRSVAQVLAFDNVQLEARHDYIQWLFPLDRPSLAVPGSPILTSEDVDRLRASSAARENLHAAAARMDQFYSETAQWLRPYDHNHLRISRIIASLRRLAGDETAQTFRAAILARVKAAAAHINAQSLDHWDRA